MGNFVGIINEPNTYEGLSEEIKNFIKTHKKWWDRFVIKVEMAHKCMDQETLNSGIKLLAPCLDEYNTKDNMKGEEMWKEIWEWICNKYNNGESIIKGNDNH